jgi:uracil-DNA glycosylase
MVQTDKINPRIESSWKDVLQDEFNADYFFDLKQFILLEKKRYTIYPPVDLIFSAFDQTPFDKVKVVILGQDPYHGKGQAHGLCFSVPDGMVKPPSLKNIFKELNNDLGLPIPDHGNLEAWAQKGVLLLNATLTVRANQAGSHQNKGWEIFTDAAIQALSEKRENIVFILWGNYARAKLKLIDQNKHFILEAPHPSPFSAERGFFGCKHFSKTNKLLRDVGLEEVDWRID